MHDFATDLSSIEDRVRSIQPELYARSRNYSDGAVSRLSPYISRGVISTKSVFQAILKRDLPFYKIEKFIQELAWRDYWQQIWIERKDEIDFDLKQAQTPVQHHKLPIALLKASTGIEAIDIAIQELEQTGYMHNHMRMYIASISCNIGQSHWLQPAQWMYSHLLDGDWASNALSWQWVAGSNAKKKYYANQENINKYFHSQQKGTFLDVTYDQIDQVPIPKVLKETQKFNCKTPLPVSANLKLDNKKKTLIYNYYNLDPEWYKNENVNRVLLLEPPFFKKYPVTQKCIDFVLDLSKNIENIQVFVGAFEELQNQFPEARFVYKEHPTNSHYSGDEESRDWMFEVKGEYPSFFKFWKLCKKEIKKSHHVLK